MELYKDYTKEPVPFLLNDTTLSSDNPLRFRKNLLQNDNKITNFVNKIEQIKAQFNLEGQKARILALSSGNIGKHEFLTGEDVLPEKGLLEKATTIERFQYSPSGSELKNQTNVVGKNIKE